MIAALDRLHRSIAIAFLDRRSPFVGKSLGPLPISKENPSLGGAPYPPADNLPLGRCLPQLINRENGDSSRLSRLEHEYDTAFTATPDSRRTARVLRRVALRNAGSARPIARVAQPLGEGQKPKSASSQTQAEEDWGR